MNEETTKKKKFKITLIDILSVIWAIFLVLAIAPVVLEFMDSKGPLELLVILLILPFVIFSFITLFNVLKRKSFGLVLFNIEFLFLLLDRGYELYILFKYHNTFSIYDAIYLLPLVIRIVFFKKIKNEEKIFINK